ncbi:alpha-tocopherol transfer protein-like [Choristoneura fumiferana]|uniref:alpha-tocopherol transfer protein-like n=1 Tax=Choristoneura fumiferana TaxID=7141 RepID=UPI003D153B67
MCDVKYDHPLLQLTEKQVRAVRDYGGLDLDRLKEGVQTVLDWCSKEEHLQAAVPYLAKTIMVERMLLLSKGSVEICKKRIDHVLTARGLIPELALNRKPEEFKEILNCVNYVALPKVHPVDNSRVLICKFKEDLENFTLLRYFRYAFYLGEYRLYDDYGIAERYVVDMKNLNLGILAKINPVVLKKAEILSTEGYGTKIKGIHLLNAPSFVDKFVFLLKQGMKQKVAERIHVHSTYEDFHEHVPKEILPKDYGGDAPSVEKLDAAWTDLLRSEEAQRMIKDLDKIVSDESRRTSSKFNEEYLGMPGSFRKLDVD